MHCLQTDTKNPRRGLTWDIIFRNNAHVFPTELPREKKDGKKSAAALVTMPFLMVDPHSNCFPDQVGLPKHVVQHEGGAGDMEFVVATPQDYLRYWLRSNEIKGRSHRYGEPRDVFVFASLAEQKEYLMTCNLLAGKLDHVDQAFLSLPDPVLHHHQQVLRMCGQMVEV